MLKMLICISASDSLVINGAL